MTRTKKVDRIVSPAWSHYKDYTGDKELFSLNPRKTQFVITTYDRRIPKNPRQISHYHFESSVLTPAILARNIRRFLSTQPGVKEIGYDRKK